MITVILLFQATNGFFKGQPFAFTQTVYLRFKSMNQLLFCNAAQGIIRPVHADVVQLVQVAEHADLCKLGDTRQEHEAQVAVGALQHPVKGFQDAAVFIEQILIEQGLKQRFVVFVYQDDSLLAGQRTRPFYHIGKTFFGTAVFPFVSV